MHPEEYYTSRLEKQAFLLGAISIPSIFLFPVIAPFLFGSMSIVLAVLSKGGSLHFSRRGRQALLLGLAGILINIAYLGFALSTVRTMLADPSLRQQLSDLIYRQYGMTLDELMPELSRLPFFQ